MSLSFRSLVASSILSSGYEIKHPGSKHMWPDVDENDSVARSVTRFDLRRT